MKRVVINLDSEPVAVRKGETDFNYGYNVMEKLYRETHDPLLNPGVPYSTWEKQHESIQGKVIGRAMSDTGSEILEERHQSGREGNQVLSDDQWSLFRDYASQVNDGERSVGKQSGHRSTQGVPHGTKRGGTRRTHGE
jgi:hypothetical protein